MQKLIKDLSYMPENQVVMKNSDNQLNQEESWNEFEVIARTYNRAVQYVNRTLRNKVLNFHNQTRQNRRICLLDTDQVLDYTYWEEELATMDEFRVQRHNERFGFSVENPSDAISQEYTSN